MKAIGVILAGGNNEKLGVLTDKRALAAIPVGSCYRSLDFSLSSMSNSGIGKVAVITQYNSRSLHDHLSSAKWWNLGRKQGGLFVFSPYLSNNNSFWFRGTADSLYQNITYLKYGTEPYVIIASGDAVYKMDFNQLLKQHVSTGAEITLVYKDIENEDIRNYGAVELDSTGRLIDLEEKPIEHDSSKISMGIYVISRTLLIKLLDTIIPEGRYDFVKDIVIRYRRKLKIMGYKFEGYWRAINSINSYFNTNMDFLKKDVRELFTKNYPYIETKPKDEPPAKFNSGSRSCNTLVGSGSILNGFVDSSVLFRRVFTGENSVIKNSIIMNGCYIGNNCVIENAILDKEVVLSDGKQIIGGTEEPTVIPMGSVL